MVNRLLAKFVSRARPFLGRLRANTAGNVLVLVAAALPPILILIGGGVDMSRAYMAQTSLQNACDAGVLAGRRAQAKSGAWTQVEIDKSRKMFDINFQGTAANASGTAFTPSNPSVGVVSATAVTTVPTTIMRMFGTNTFSLSAACSAEFQISNIDVMMVLDTTGSMADCPDNSTCNSGTGSKIEGLKSAIRSFYYTIAASVPAGGNTRVRFGFVPYNGTVNLTNFVSGASATIPTTSFAASTQYQSRVANFTTPTKTITTRALETATYTKQSKCDNWANANSVTTGTSPNTTTVSYNEISYDKNTDQCVREVLTAVSSGSVVGYTLTNFTYKPVSIDTTNLRAMSSVLIATGIPSWAVVPTSGSYNLLELGSMSGTHGLTITNKTWGGCIEERATVNSLISASSIPTGATDLDFVTAPVNGTASTQWKPYISELEFDRNQTAALTSGTDYAPMTAYCPPAATNFATVDTSSATTVPPWIETYLGTLYAWGGTYHDIGMIWGARLGATSGINAATVNAGSLSSVSRHIIFLTDGAMAPACKGLYSAYGQEYLDNRVMPVQATTGSTCDNTLISYHNGRYLAACQRAKDMGYTVWVIGFGQTLTTQMTACASGGRAYYAGDTSSLQTTFRTIASQVADLRLKT